jgi:hypothetical protein
MSAATANPIDPLRDTATNPHYREVTESENMHIRTYVGERVRIIGGVLPRWDDGATGTIVRLWQHCQAGTGRWTGSADLRALVALDGRGEIKDYSWSEFSRAAWHEGAISHEARD